MPPGGPPQGDGLRILVCPGAGFGDGAPPTPQVCLQAIAALAPGGWQAAGDTRRPWRMLDFGSGTGILSIGAALLGADVVGVEIEAVAIATAAANATRNGVAARVRFTRRLADAPGPFDLVVANILRPVLLAHADDLVARLASGGGLVLSGLVRTDVPEVGACYAHLLGGRRPEVYRRGDWCALAWRPG